MTGGPNVLHITNWYPHHWDPMEGLFVERHVNALRAHGRHDVWQIDVREGPKWGWNTRALRADRTFQFHTVIRFYRAIETIALLLVLWAWFTRDRKRKYDLVNFVMAYPNAASVRWLRRIMGVPVTITEHWTAYHFGFRSTSSGLDRIRRIFQQRIPVVVVSQALADDIARFSGANDIPFHVIDNVVDQTLFRYDPASKPATGRYFALMGLRKLKRPDVLIDAIALLRERGINARLRIAGKGPLREELQQRIDRLGVNGSVELIGPVEPDAAAREMSTAHALLHCTDYETFSVVCAEALCCGTPVIASAVGPLPTFVNEQNGVLVANNAAEEWTDAIAANAQRLLSIDRAELSRCMRDRTRATTVGARYNAILKQVVDDARRAR